MAKNYYYYYFYTFFHIDQSNANGQWIVLALSFFYPILLLLLLFDVHSYANEMRQWPMDEPIRPSLTFCLKKPDHTAQMPNLNHQNIIHTSLIDLSSPIMAMCTASSSSLFSMRIIYYYYFTC